MQSEKVRKGLLLPWSLMPLGGECSLDVTKLCFYIVNLIYQSLVAVP